MTTTSADMKKFEAAGIKAAEAEPEELITEDVWNVTFEDDSNRLRWSQKNLAQRAFTVLIGVLRAALVLGLLYIFIIGLDLLGSGFQIVGGTAAGRAFRNSDLFNNPIAGLVIGILTTVLVQSSSTSTSIIITMTASNLMTVDQAVPMIMGANIGMHASHALARSTACMDACMRARTHTSTHAHTLAHLLLVAHAHLHTHAHA